MVNTVSRLLLCMLVIAVQACTTTPEYQDTAGDSPEHVPQAVLFLAPGPRLGEARRIQLTSVNGERIGAQHADLIRIPPGKNSLDYVVEWSNGFVQDEKITFEARTGASYRLSAYELKEGEKEPPPVYRSPDIDSWGDMFEAALADTLMIGFVIPLAIITSPVWVPVGIAEERELNKLPFRTCCFVWIEENGGEVKSGKKPNKLVEHERLLRLAEAGNANGQYLFYRLNPSRETVTWLCRAADQGHELARSDLGNMYLPEQEADEQITGIQIQPDISRACMWFHLAGQARLAEPAEPGEPVYKMAPYATVEVERTKKAMNASELEEAERLIQAWAPGQCDHDFSRFMITEYAKDPAVAKLCRAADLGDFSSRDELGRIYFHGVRGVRPDLARAYMWYHLAADVYIPPRVARGRMQIRCDAMTPEQRATAIKLLEEWRPGDCEQDLLEGNPGPQTSIH